MKEDLSVTDLRVLPALFNLVHGPYLMQVFGESVAHTLNIVRHLDRRGVHRIGRERGLLKRLRGPVEHVL